MINREDKLPGRPGIEEGAMQHLRRTVLALSYRSRPRITPNLHFYHIKNFHYGRQSMLDTNRRHSGSRSIGAASAFIPRITFFRVFWTVTTGALGLVSYKLSGKIYFLHIQ